MILSLRGNNLDNIIIKRFWQDVDFFQLDIVCKSKYIIAHGKVYTSDALIDELYNAIDFFLTKNEGTICWNNGRQGNLMTPNISFTFSYKDNLGHVQIEVFMEIDDGETVSGHNCCFYVNTEIGLLYQFKENLLKLKIPQLGMQISLTNQE